MWSYKRRIDCYQDEAYYDNAAKNSKTVFLEFAPKKLYLHDKFLELPLPAAYYFIARRLEHLCVVKRKT